MPEVVNTGVRIRYDVSGHGLPLVLLHGWTCDRTWWAHSGYLDDLQQDYTLINVDLRGHGDSDKPHDSAAYRTETVVGDVLGVVDAEGIDRFAIWGLSYGGWIAWMTAHARPGRVAAMITSGAWNPRPDTEEEWEAFDQGVSAAVRRDGMQGMVDVLRAGLGDPPSRELFPVGGRFQPASRSGGDARDSIA